MGPDPENKLMVSPPGEAAPATALAAPGLSGAPTGAVEGRLAQMDMRLDVMLRVPSFRVRDLLTLDRGTVVETDHDHTQDIPVRCGGALLAWAEFEVVNEGLAVRLTRLG